MRRCRRLLILPLIVGSALGVPPAVAASKRAAGTTAWPMFHRDGAHTGLSDVTLSTTWRPAVRWTFRMTPPAPVSPTDDAAPVGYRWTSTFPVGDLNGDGKLDVVATTPDGTDGPDQVVALTDAPGTKTGVRTLWTYTAPTSYRGTDVRKGFDTYSPALVDVDGDRLPDVVFTTKDGRVRALKGTNGAGIWEYNLDRRTEAGPMVGDLDGDGTPEIVVVTDCRSLASTACPEPADRAHLVVLPTTPTGGKAPVPVWTVDYPYKMDSAMPAIADFDRRDGQARKAVVAGTWGGELLIAWQRPDGSVATKRLAMSELDAPATRESTPVIRTSPLVVDWGAGPVVVFGWLPTDLRAGFGRLSAVSITLDVPAGTGAIRPLWTIADLDTWKSSPALLPGSSPSSALVAVGYGLAAPRDGQSETVGRCQQRFVFGGIAAVDQTGRIVWRRDLPGEGNIRASAAVAPGGKGRSVIVIPVGCYGAVYGFDQGGTQLWRTQLGLRSQGSPAIADLDGDGSPEVITSSYDGNVWVLSDARVLGKRARPVSTATASGPESGSHSTPANAPSPEHSTASEPGHLSASDHPSTTAHDVAPTSTKAPEHTGSAH